MATFQCGTSTFIGIELDDADFTNIENAAEKISFSFTAEQVKNFLDQDPSSKQNLNEREKRFTSKLLINLFVRTLDGLKRN